MRIRLPFAGSLTSILLPPPPASLLADIALPGAFLFLLAAAGYAGLTSLQLDAIINDKVLHCLTFFILTTCFYWILYTTRRRSLNLTLLVCTAFLGIGSEILQGFLPNGRTFDFYDIVANIVGSLTALGLSSWYHTRMLERKRLAKHYQAVPADEEQDLELGEGVTEHRNQELRVRRHQRRRWLRK